MAGVTEAARFGAHRVARGRAGGVRRASCRIRHRHLFKGPRVHPATQGLVQGVQGEGKTRN